jgi:hypothetical protein
VSAGNVERPPGGGLDDTIHAAESLSFAFMIVLFAAERQMCSALPQVLDSAADDDLPLVWTLHSRHRPSWGRLPFRWCEPASGHGIEHGIPPGDSFGTGQHTKGQVVN